MVDPIPNEDRARALRWAKIGTGSLVGLSAGLIAIQSGGSLAAVVVAVVSGLLVGAILVWYLFPDADAIAPASNRRYRK